MSWFIKAFLKIASQNRRDLIREELFRIRNQSNASQIDTILQKLDKNDLVDVVKELKTYQFINDNFNKSLLDVSSYKMTNWGRVNFSLYGFPGIDLQYKIEIPGVSIQNVVIVKDIYDDFIKNAGDIVLDTPKAIYVKGTLRAWNLFLDLAYLWYPSSPINLNTLPLFESVDGKYVKSKANDVSEFLKKNQRTIANQFKIENIAYESKATQNKEYAARKTIVSAVEKDAYVYVSKKTQKRLGIEITFNKLSNIFYDYKFMQLLKDSGLPYLIYASRNAVFIAYPTQPSNIGKILEIRSWLSGEGYNSFQLNSIIKKLNQKEYDKYNREEWNQSQIDILSDSAKISKRNSIDKASTCSRVASVLFPENQYEQIENNPQFLEDVKNSIHTKYQHVFDPENNLFLKNNPDIAENIKNKQLEGVVFGLTRSSFVLADQPGSGKTIQASIIADMQTKIDDSISQQEGELTKHQILVISPGQIIDQNWIDPQKSALKSYLDPNVDKENNIQYLHQANFQPISNARWVVVSYSMFKDESTPERRKKIKQLISEIKSHPFSVVLLDESQILKKTETDLTKNILKAITNIPKKVSMTGTPSDNTPQDLYGILRAIDHPALHNVTLDQFSNAYFPGYKELDIDRFQNLAHSKQARALLELLSEFFIRQKREDINPNLAGLFSVSKEAVPLEVNWNEIYDKAIDHIARMNVQRLKGDNLTEEDVNKRKSVILENIKNSTSEVGAALQGLALQQASSYKIPFTVNSVYEHLSNNPKSKVLVLTNFVNNCKQISEQLQQKGIQSNYVAGEVTGDERNNVVESFTNGDLQAIVFTIQTGAVGFNFQMADLCVFNDSSWNPSVNEQATDRVRRITSRNPVKIIYKVIEDDNPANIDQKMFKIMEAKKVINSAIHNVLRDSLGIKENTQLSEEEREEQLNEKAEQLIEAFAKSIEADRNARLSYSPSVNL